MPCQIIGGSAGRLSWRPVRLTLQLATDRVAAGEQFPRASTPPSSPTIPRPRTAGCAAAAIKRSNPFVALSFVAAATTRLRVQTHALVAAYRNPFLTAKAIASLDVLSRGRLIVGIAAGYFEPEFAALGVDYAERNELSDEAIEVMKQIFRGGSLELEFRRFRAAGHTVLQRPAQ